MTVGAFQNTSTAPVACPVADGGPPIRPMPTLAAADPEPVPMRWACQSCPSVPCQNTSTTPGENVVADGSPATGFAPICCGPFHPATYQLCFTLALVAFQNTSMTPLACAAACEACRELHAA